MSSRAAPTLGARDTPLAVDLLIKNGNVIDGTGVPWYRADVAVAGDKIVDIGFLGDAEAAETIDASGRFVTPGFVEEHGHSDVTVLVDPRAQSAVRQGMTTLVLGLVRNVGRSNGPFNPRRLYARRAPVQLRGIRVDVGGSRRVPSGPTSLK